MSTAVLDRRVLTGHDGRSGARIETGRLEDGTRVYVKTSDPERDAATLLTGTGTRELELFRAGVFERLPAGVDIALLDVDVVAGEVVTVSRDVSACVLGWDRVLDVGDVRRVLAGAVAVHREFAADPPPGLCPLEARLTLLAPDRAAALRDQIPDLGAAVCRGWELFGDLVPDDVADAVRRAQTDPGPLAAAMSSGGVSLAHGDYWLVNLALGSSLLLLDWGIATLGPPTLDLVTFCVGATSNVAMSREALLAEARAACTGLVDPTAFAAAELWGLMELGWNKALDAIDHDDPAKRATERADLDFWVGRARAALEAGVGY